VIFTEADPQTDAAYLSQLQQLHGLIPVVGTEPTVQPPWAKAVGGAIGKDNLAKYFVGAQPYSASQGPAWQVYNTALLASGATVPQPSQWSQDPLQRDRLRLHRDYGPGHARGEDARP